MKTRITLLLDRSASMNAIKATTISGFNEYIAGLQASDVADDIRFDFIQFDSFSTDVLYRNAPVKTIKPLNDESFQPRGNTPLIDAAMWTLKAIDDAHAEKGAAVTPNPITLTEGKMQPGKQVVVFLTDGEENASTRYKTDELKREVENRQGKGWEFVFMGVGFNAYGQASSMGVRAASTVSLSGSAASQRHTYAGLATNTVGYASGEASTMDWNNRQRGLAEEDKVDPKAKGRLNEKTQ